MSRPTGANPGRPKNNRHKMGARLTIHIHTKTCKGRHHARPGQPRRCTDCYEYSQCWGLHHANGCRTVLCGKCLKQHEDQQFNCRKCGGLYCHLKNNGEGTCLDCVARTGASDHYWVQVPKTK